MSESQEPSLAAEAAIGSQELGGSSRSRGLTHSVSIFVEAVYDECEASPSLLQPSDKRSGESSRDSDEEQRPEEGELRQQLPRQGRHQSSPVILMEDHVAGTS